MLPEKTHPDWKSLVTGEKVYPLENFVLQLKVTQTAKDINTGKLSVDKAVDDIYDLCLKYRHAVMKDMEKIFNS